MAEPPTPALDIIGEMIDFHPGYYLLDIGCGEGHLLSTFESREGLLVGIDIWGTRIRSIGVNLPNTSPVIGNGERLPFIDKSFDRISLTFVLEHASNPRGLLLEVARVLKPGGLFAIASPNSRSLIGFLVAATPINLRNCILCRVEHSAVGSFSFDDETVHYEFCSVGRLDRYLGDIGMERMKLRMHVGRPPIRSKAGILGRLFQIFWRANEAIVAKRAFKSFSPTFLAVYRMSDL
jgi:SAM-dependent methyltransferase